MSDSTLDETEYLTPMQVAKLLKVSLVTVLNRFSKEPGVIDMTPKEKRKPGVRRKRLLRIPRGVLNRYLHENRVR
jgi:hypothetical protein